VWAEGEVRARRLLLFHAVCPERPVALTFLTSRALPAWRPARIIFGCRKQSGALTARSWSPCFAPSAAGDFTVTPPPPAGPEERKISKEIEAIFELNRRLARQLQKISESVGKEGQIRQRADLGHVARLLGGLRGLPEYPHRGPRAAHHRGVTRHRRGREGDLSQKIGLEIDGRPMKGEFLRTAQTVNTMSTNSAPSPPRSRAWPARSVPRASSAARRRSRAFPAPGRTSPITSTRWRAT